MSVQQKIDLAIRASGSISIQDFVEISNFSKNDGFYNSEEIQKIGNRGHFITSPEISSLFGICLTNQFLSVFSEVKKVRQGKYFDIEVNIEDEKKAKAKVEEMCEKLLANLVIEDYTIL